MSQNGKRADIPLDIALDYPIGWDFRIVLRDLVQNFYDAIGAEYFEKEFEYVWNESDSGNSYNLRMSTKNHPFSYEWLTYVGGSTKTGRGTSYVGEYGEGFKMSALRVVQMGGMTLTMHSQGWQIMPVSYEETIDDRTVMMLGYDYRVVDDDGVTSLHLSGIPLSEKSTLKNALLDYYFEGNALFGEKIGEGNDYSIYKRSDVPIPCKQAADDLKGILFMNHIARGRLDIPLIINYQREIFWDKRSRPTLTQMDTQNYLHECFNKLSPHDSAVVLRILKPYWSDLVSGMRDINTKYYLICQLVRNVAKDKKEACDFTDEMEQLAFLEKKGSDIKRNHIIDETKRWWMSNRSKKLVNPIFRLLGAENLVETYIKTRYQAYDEPDELQQRRYDILKQAIVAVIPIIKPEDLSCFVIDIKGNESYDPLQFSERVYGNRKSRAGRKYHITKLVMQKDDFSDDSFTKSFVKVADAYLHTYGTSRSEKVNAFLTALGQWIIENDSILAKYEEEWRS